MRKRVFHHKTSNLAALILFLLVSATAGWNRASSAVANDPFPQRLGNQWTYVRTGLGEPRTWTNEIDQAALGRWRHTNYWGDGKARWLTENGAGDVFEVVSNLLENFWYRFSASPGTAWTMAVSSDTPPCVNGARLTMAAREKVDAPAGLFDNCQVIRYRTNCADAGVVAEWFAPGVGLVKRTETSFAGEVTTVLQSATVNGVEYPAGVKLEVALDKSEYTYDLMPPLPPVVPGPTVRAQIRLVNNSSSDITLDFRTSQRYDFMLEGPKGKLGYQWSADKAFLMVLGQVTVKPGDSLSFAETFSLPDSQAGILPAGDYTLKAIITSIQPYSGAIPVKIIHAR